MYLRAVKTKEVDLQDPGGVRVMLSQGSLCPQRRVIIEAADPVEGGHSISFEDLSMGCRQ